MYVLKMEIDVVRPLKPLLYSRYVDDIYNRCKKDEFDEVFHALNNYHENIKLTTELSPSKFLNTQITNMEGKYITKVHRKETKKLIHWSSITPKRYKRNTITTDLHIDIKRNIKHVFKWKILCPGPSQKHLRKNLEAIFIALYKPSLNDEKPFDRLMLFRNGITVNINNIVFVLGI